MLLGALMLVKSPLTHAGVSLGVAGGVTLPFAFITVMLMRLVLSSRDWKPSTGREQLVGAPAEVTQALTREGESEEFQGMVRLHGELWRAVAKDAIPAGAQVRVTRTVGLTVHVVPAEHHVEAR
jgi:membrane-bound serine protease (ClpP class)